MLNGDELNAMWAQRHRSMMTPEYEREQFERGLLSQEQQRRQYDSETARESAKMQGQKYNILGGLLKNIGRPAMGASAFSGYAPPRSSRRVPSASPGPFDGN